MLQKKRWTVLLIFHLCLQIHSPLVFFVPWEIGFYCLVILNILSSGFHTHKKSEDDIITWAPPLQICEHIFQFL